MELIAALAILAIAQSAPAATQCEIKGDAAHWAYDACFWQFETDDDLHPGVVACAERNLALVRSEGACPATRIFKSRICKLVQQTGDRLASFEACMADPSVEGSTVRNGGL
ncbi:hypothetical protein LDO32_04660 [Luteimonas sp. Y-2-2-4F]|nr:hypothetical protein [Luteimonas sp. Y-2-2-4F]MCD9031020.1 hypothetical protein [Luteimonas sp. Y-2-2-4F]